MPSRSSSSSFQPSPPINRFQKGNVILKVTPSNASGATQPNMCVAPPPGATRIFIAGNTF